MNDIDLSIFGESHIYDDVSSQCNQAYDKIIKHCKYLQRLSIALTYYNAVNPSQQQSQDVFLRFCVENYVDLLDDIYHLQKEHDDQLQEIQTELITFYGFNPCSLKKCVFSQRHYGEKRELLQNDDNKYNEDDKDSEYSFYEQVMDGLHFNIFHLYNVGLRYNLNNEEIKIDVDDEEEKQYKCIDHVFGKMAHNIHINRDKYDGRFSRMGRTSNMYSKYTINVGFEKNQNQIQQNELININKAKYGKYEGQPTLMDMLFVYMINNSVNETKIDKIGDYILEEEYDTDSLMQDLEDSNNQSNIQNVIRSSKLISMIKNYIHDSKLSESSFSTGLTFWYWPYYHPSEVEKRDRNNKQWRDNMNDYSGYKISDLYIDKPIHKNMKEEIINSGFCTMEEFIENIALKSAKYINTNTAKKTKALTRHRWDGIRTTNIIYTTRHQYGIKPGSPLSVDNLQAIITYCDMTELCTNFSSTFRPIHFGETLCSIKKRNRNYYWLSKTLRETVEYFGTTGLDKQENIGIVTSIETHEHGPFFCGMSNVMVIPAFNIRLCGPSSTSKKKEIAINFAKDKGIILQLNNNGDRRDRNNLHLFDCSWVSNYKEEDERLFFGGYWRLRLESVRIIKTKQNFQRFFNALFYFDAMVDGSSMRPAWFTKKNYIPPNLTRDDNIILNDLINIELGKKKDDKIDDYVCKTFHLFCQKKSIIVLDLAELDDNFSSISSLIMYPIQIDPAWYSKDKRHINRNLFRPLLFRLFPNVKEIIMITNDRGGQINYSFSFSSFKKLYSSVDEYKTSTKITIKAYHPVFSVSRSWIYNAWNLISSELDNTGFKISRKVLKHPRTTLIDTGHNAVYENRRSDAVTIIREKYKKITVNTSINNIVGEAISYFGLII